MRKLQSQGVHHITLVGADRQTSIDFWEGVLGMPFVFEQPNLDNEAESHLYFDPGDGRLITVFTNEDRDADPTRTPTDPGCVHHLAFSLSQATFDQAVERLDERGIEHSGVKDRGFMDSIYFDDPLGLLIELASYRFEPPFGFTHADVLLEAHKLRVGARRLQHRRDPPRRRDRGARRCARATSLSDDRSPKNPYSEAEEDRHGRDHAQHPQAERQQPDRPHLRARRRARLRGGRRLGQDAATPEFLAKDPAHLTPMIEEDGLPRGSLWESCAIMQYLCNKHGLDAVLSRPTRRERAMVDSAMFYLIGTLYPLVARATYPALGFPQYPGEVGSSDADDDAKAAAQQAATDALAEPLDVFRAFFLDGKRFIGGDAPSIADIRLAATLEFLRAIDYDFPAWARSTWPRWRRRSARRTPSRPPTCAATSST